MSAAQRAPRGGRRERIADYPGEAGGGDPRRPTRSQAGRLPPAADEPQDNRMIDDERSRL
jgi:hypothetical protein